MCAAAGIWFAVAVVVAAFDRGEKPTVELAFVEATVLPISWTVRIIHVSTLHPRFVQGSNVRVVEERAELTAAIYDEITVRGYDFTAVRLTPSAYAHGLALALPERVRLELARPEGFEPPTY